MAQPARPRVCGWAHDATACSRTILHPQRLQFWAHTAHAFINISPRTPFTLPPLFTLTAHPIYSPFPSRHDPPGPCTAAWPMTSPALLSATQRAAGSSTLPSAATVPRSLSHTTCAQRCGWRTACAAWCCIACRHPPLPVLHGPALCRPTAQRSVCVHVCGAVHALASGAPEAPADAGGLPSRPLPSAPLSPPWVNPHPSDLNPHLQVAVGHLKRLPVLEGFPVDAVPRSPYPNDSEIYNAIRERVRKEVFKGTEVCARIVCDGCAGQAAHVPMPLAADLHADGAASSAACVSRASPADRRQPGTICKCQYPIRCTPIL